MTSETFKVIDEMSEALLQAEVTHDARLNGAHLAEIEEEAKNILDCIVALRVAARERDAEAGQEALAELIVALDHLVDHAQFLLPSLKVQLDLTDEEVPAAGRRERARLSSKFRLNLTDKEDQSSTPRSQSQYRSMA